MAYDNHVAVEFPSTDIMWWYRHIIDRTSHRIKPVVDIAVVQFVVGDSVIVRRQLIYNYAQYDTNNLKC